MQGRGNRHGRIWLLSGTGEGPRLAAALLQLGWFVEASVVTPAAARAYDGLKLHHLHIGPLQGQEAMQLLRGLPDEAQARVAEGREDGIFKFCDGSCRVERGHDLS